MAHAVVRRSYLARLFRKHNASLRH